MTAARTAHTATLLGNGKVLIAGGYSDKANLRTAELYDPATRTFTATGSMAAARVYHTATLLLSGKVLIAGGTEVKILASAELYDPTTGTFTATGDMAVETSAHTATLLSSGKVLVAGGSDGREVYTNAELYDPTTGTFAATGSMSAARMLHTMTWLPSGKVLVAGGMGEIANTSYTLGSMELYDPTIGTFTVTEAMAEGRYEHTATLLTSGEVLIAKGRGWDGMQTLLLRSSELYGPETGTFKVTGSAADATRALHTATLLSNGTVLLAGGWAALVVNTIPNALATAELYNPAAMTFTPLPNMTTPRKIHTATLLGDGQVLIAGGSDDHHGLASAELFQ
jgi:hypothetical protein